MSKKTTVKALLELYGRTFCDEVGIPVGKNQPAPLFQLLCASLLYSARISTDNASRAMRALLDAGYTTSEKMAGATWQERVDVITWHGYKRYDEKTSTQLGELAERVEEEYRGDLRELRERADRDVERERKLVTEFKGIGDVGADIFLREVQVAWDEVYPHADDKVLSSARRLDLGDDPRTLVKLVSSKKDFTRLTAALIRVDLENGYHRIEEAA